ncbi:MAG: GNAT family N-acetyltransferase [Chitinophagales bacterium]|nr:GNAT family N-acetyltransferase [Chitinophagales bacterium]
MLIINLHPFPVLSTERLLLREITESDADDLFRLQGNAEVMKHIALPLNAVEESVLKIKFYQDLLAKQEVINWAITLKPNNTLIGVILLKAIDCKNHRSEVGYMVHPDFWRKGIAQEALECILDYAFNTLNFHSLEAIIDPYNTASEKILEKNGFVKEAHFKENYFLDGQFLDSGVYSLLKSNYKAP